MLSRAVSGYSATQVENQLLLPDGVAEYRIRLESVDARLNKIRDLKSVILRESSIRHVADQLIKRTAQLNIRQANIELDPFDEMMAEAAPAIYLRMNEQSGTSLADASGLGRTGTANNSPTLGVEGLLAGLTDTAITLNGTDEYISIAHNAAYNAAAFTAIIWFKTADTSGSLVNRDDGTNRYLNIGIDGSGNLFATATFTSGSPTTFTATAAVNDGDEHVAVVEYDGAHFRISIDSLQLVNTPETRTMASPTLGWNIGRSQASGGSAYLACTVAHFAFLPRAISEQEDRNFYQSGADDLAEIDYGRDRIRVFIAIRMPDGGWAEVAVGVFVLSSPVFTAEEEAVIVSVDAYDQSIILRDDKVTDTFSIALGENYISGANGIIDIIESAGFDTSGWAITATSSILPAAREWTVGTSKLDIINELLGAINYKPFRFNPLGIGVIEANVLPEHRTPEFSFLTDDRSIIEPGADTSLNLDGVPNIIVGVVADGGRPTLISTAENSRFDSPTSTARRRNGNEPIRVPLVIFTDAADQTALDAVTVQFLAEASQIYRTGNFKSAFVFFMDDDDCIGFQHTRLKVPPIAALVKECEIPLDETGSMSFKYKAAAAVT